MNYNAEKLLRHNLETMHKQCGQWVEDLEFYDEELKFFNSLISDRIDTRTTDDLEHKEIFRNIDALLYRLSEDLIQEIKNHRNKIDVLIADDDLYNHFSENKEHFQLLEKMGSIKHGIKKLKKALFRYIEDHPFEFDFDTILKEI
jgi:hypothetical protein